jgi:oligosaccharyltransferase complex subunit delta (ribophorin II)
MRLSLQVLRLGLLASVVPSVIAVSWGFRDATVSIQKKGAGVGAGIQEKYVPCTGHEMNIVYSRIVTGK